MSNIQQAAPCGVRTLGQSAEQLRHRRDGAANATAVTSDGFAFHYRLGVWRLESDSDLHLLDGSER